MNARRIGLGLAGLALIGSALRAGLAPAAGLESNAHEPATIVGRVWIDRCRPGAATCVPLSDGHERADGIQQADEPGVAGITVTLTTECVGEPIAQTTTNAGGVFVFEGLDAGAYCVTVDPTRVGNELIAAGRWTTPLSARPGAPASRIVLLSAGRIDSDVVFGRDTAWIWPMD